MGARVTTRDELEAALRVRPDDATLRVYADLLQAEGDPRGELIALDVEGIRDYKRRGQLLTAWLGDDIPVAWSAAHELWYAGDLDGTHATFECGFIDITVTEGGAAPALRVLASPASDHVRRLSLSGPTYLLAAVLAQLVARRRPWLQHVAIARPRSEPALLVGASLGRAFAEATPALEVLDLDGRNLFERFTHPNLRELGVTGTEAIDLADGPPFPSLHAIDYQHDESRPRSRPLLAAARMPAVRRLCLARSQPGRALYALLGTLPIAAQLSQLVVPAVRTSAEAALVQAAIDRMPVLRELVIARDYEPCAGAQRELRHPWAQVRWPEPAPWWPPDMLAGAVVRVDDDAIELASLAALLDDSELADDERWIWWRFWTAVLALPAHHEHAFPAADLARGLDALGELPPEIERVHEALAERAPGTLVRMRRWG
jgi:uncharacterized protein (TIGR02996 family)